jgi:hypothetical protein
MFCSKCGASNADDATFCAACGNSLKASAPSSAPSPAPGPSSSPQPDFSLGTIPSGPATFRMSTAFSNAINLVKSPAAFMRQNKDNAVPLNTTMIGYVAVLAAIPFVATLIGDLWYYAYLRVYAYSFGVAITTYILDIIAVFVIGFAIWKLAPNFGGATDQARATMLAAFVYSPVFLISILNIIPFIGWIGILGLLYGLFILYLGLPIMLGTPADKLLMNVVVIVVVALVVFAVIGAIVGAVTTIMFLR